jgi:hypothetical protein
VNQFGSYRALLGNSVSALSAALEIYNKPRIEYRDECTVILLVNAWELLLKAMLSKNRVRIFYKKRASEPYRTYSLSDSLNRATPYFPSSIDFGATAKNLELLVDYRDNAIHFYNEPGFGVIVYSLAQAAITNFRDVAKLVFGKDISAEINLALLPLSLAAPVDPISFVRKSEEDSSTSPSVRQFNAQLRALVIELESASADTGRLMTVFHPVLISTKKISQADITVGIDATAGSGPPVLIQQRVDPNRTHPYREVDIITRNGKTGGLGIFIGKASLTQFPFRALGHHLKVKEDPKFYWADQTGAVARYSDAYVSRIKSTSEIELAAALKSYRAYMATRHR